MSRWTWVALGVVLAAGVATVWYWCQLLAYTLPGLPPPAVEPKLVASSALPTALFVAAAILRRRSTRTQGAVAASAVGTGLLQVLTIRWELAAEWGHGTGFFSFLALAAASGVAVVVLAIAAVEAFRRRGAMQVA